MRQSQRLEPQRKKTLTLSCHRYLTIYIILISSCNVLNIACALLKLTGTILVSAVASPNPSDLYLDTMNDMIFRNKPTIAVG